MMYLLSDVINTAGLAFDIIGVILLFFFGLPSRVREGATRPLVWRGSRQHEAAGEAVETVSVRVVVRPGPSGSWFRPSDYQ